MWSLSSSYTSTGEVGEGFGAVADAMGGIVAVGKISASGAKGFRTNFRGPVLQQTESSSYMHDRFLVTCVGADKISSTRTMVGFLDKFYLYIKLE